ncbi:MAG: FmdB family zinc ribbon protein [Jatrophihabitantaceae bacterium]
MPTYQYACTSQACGLQFERVQAFTDAAITDCPDCSGRVRKVYGSIGVVFKGPGFYRTDSRDTKTAESKATDSSTSSSESTGKAGGADTAKPSTGGNAASSSDAKPVAAAAS